MWYIILVVISIIIFIIQFNWYNARLKQLHCDISNYTKKYLNKEYQDKEIEICNLSQKIEEYKTEIEFYEEGIASLEKGYQESSEKIKKLHQEEDNQKRTIGMLKGVIDSLEDSVEKNTEKLNKECLQAKEAYQGAYLAALEDMTKEFKTKSEEMTIEINLLEGKIKDKKKLYDSIVAAQLNEKKEQDKINFYKLQIPEEDLNEIKKIKEVLFFIRDKESLSKIIWSSYYKKPLQDLNNRLFKKDKLCGIYKITSLTDGKIYIGQSTNVQNRFSEHIKRALGAEPATKNRLYPIMAVQGPENFTFELLEEISSDKLNEREKFWIAYYHSNEVGLNSTIGG